MKTEFLTGLGLEKSVIDQIMAEHGKTVNAEKAKVTAAQEQLTNVQEQLKAFEGVDVKELQGKVTQLSTDLKAKETEYQNRLNDIEFSRTLEGAVTTAKARNAKAVIALLDADKLKASKNQATDIAAAIEALKKDSGYLFETTQKATGPTPGPQSAPPKEGDTAAANAALRSLFGKGE